MSTVANTTAHVASSAVVVCARHPLGTELPLCAKLVCRSLTSLSNFSRSSARRCEHGTVPTVSRPSVTSGCRPAQMRGERAPPAAPVTPSHRRGASRVRERGGGPWMVMGGSPKSPMGGSRDRLCNGRARFLLTSSSRSSSSRLCNNSWRWSQQHRS